MIASTGRRRRVAVFVAALAPTDAVSDQARRHAELIRSWGHRAFLTAEQWHPSCAREVVPIERALAVADDSAWLVHYSIWSDALEQIAATRRQPKTLVYHNVTPPELLPQGGVVWQRCLRARRRLPELAGAWDLVIADSEYNAGELRHAGFGRAEVVAPILPTPSPVDGEYPRDDFVLSVGRVVPSKGLVELVRSVALLRRLHRPGAELRVIGSADGWEYYAKGLLTLADRAAGGGVNLLGRVDDATRDDHYRHAGVLCLLSRHEGFAVPVVEAMRFGTPVVALDAGAIGETLGGAGLLLPAADPPLVAEALAEVLGNPSLWSELSSRARARASHFDPALVRARLEELIRPLLDGVRGGSGP
jgi:glycosyltransferase involved in cell wall biosynthesis